MQRYRPSVRRRWSTFVAASLFCLSVAAAVPGGAWAARILGPVTRSPTTTAPAPSPAPQSGLRAALRAATPATPACTPTAEPTVDFSGCYATMLNSFLLDLTQAGPTTNAYGVTQQYGDTTMDPASTTNPSGSSRTYLFTPPDTATVTDAWPADIPRDNPNGCQSSPGNGTYTTVYNWCLTDAQIQSELSSVLARRGWTGDSNSVYLIMLPAGVDVCAGPFIEVKGANQCADTDFCAYHSNFTVSGRAAPPLYAVVPWPDVGGCATYHSPNSYAAADYGINLISHEHNEAAVDPLGDAWYADSTQDEVGDKCVFHYTRSNPPDATYNQSIGQHNYWLQDEFANSDPGNPSFAAPKPTGCESKPGASNDGTATDSKPLVYHGGPTMHIVHAYTIFWDGHAGSPPTASIVAAPATVHRGGGASFQAATASDPQGQAPTYTWSFGDGETATGQTATHAYGVSGIYTVTLTVSDADGYQSSQSRTIRVYGPPVASFTTYPAPVIAGTPIDFNSAASADSDGTITGWSWLFGDGTGASGPRVNHAYATPGVYSATLTLTDSNASSASETASVTVLARAAASLTGTAAPRAARAGSRVLLLLGRTLGCPPGPTPCAVTVSVSTLRRLVARTAGGHRRTITRNVSVASTGLSAGAGSRTSLSLALNPTGQALLRRLHRLTLTVHITVRVTGAPTLSRAISAAVSDPPVPARRR